MINIYKQLLINLKEFEYSIKHPREMWRRFKIWWKSFKKLMKFYYNNPVFFYHKIRHSWKYLISFSIAWIITNGWAYVLAIMGFAFAKWYIAFLWSPLTAEKAITFPLSGIIHKILWQESNERIKLSNKIQIDLVLIGE